MASTGLVQAEVVAIRMFPAELPDDVSCFWITAEYAFVKPWAVVERLRFFCVFGGSPESTECITF